MDKDRVLEWLDRIDIIDSECQDPLDYVRSWDAVMDACKVIRAEVETELSSDVKSWEPKRCPVCNGTKQVDNGFYRQTSGEWSSSNMAPEPCRSCNDRGWVVITEPPENLFPHVTYPKVDETPLPETPEEVKRG